MICAKLIMGFKSLRIELVAVYFICLGLCEHRPGRRVTLILQRSVAFSLRLWTRQGEVEIDYRYRTHVICVEMEPRSSSRNALTTPSP